MTALPANAAPDLFGYRKYWAERLTPAPFLPMSREEMDALGWDQCDVILVTGDADLIAVARAVSLIRSGRTPAALAGGVDEVCPTLYRELARGGRLSPGRGGATSTDVFVTGS